MALQAANIADLVKGTLNNLGRGKWTDLTSTLQRYVAMPKLLREKKVDFAGGQGIQWNVQIGTSGAARNVGMYASDNVNVADTMQQASIPWRHSNTNYAFDKREFSMNQGETQIFDLIKTRRHDAFVDLAKLCEINFWNKPVDSTDTLKPFGVPYWIVQNSTEGFTGGDPSGFTAGAAGLATATYPDWKNYSAQRIDISRADLVTRMRKAYTFCEFKAPVEGVSEYADGMGYGIYTVYNVLSGLETLLENQNDNLGNDIASKDGQVTFRRIPVEWVPYLESDTTEPVYGIDWSVYKPVFLSGWHLKEEDPTVVAGQHTVIQVNVDLTYNFKCTNRRQNWVIYK